MAHASEGSRANVYRVARVAAGQRMYALKVFKRAFRVAELAPGVARLNALAGLPGLEAATRQMVPPDDPAAQSCKQLAYAMLIPWLRGRTWFDLLTEAAGGCHLEAQAALELCASLLAALAALEQRGLAHTDVAPGNVMLDVANREVQLLDLEDIYFPALARPGSVNFGSPGYRHPSAGGGKDLWCAEGDRYAGAVLAAEILILADPALARLATDHGFFGSDTTTGEGSARYHEAAPWLNRIAPEFSALFGRAWTSGSLDRCPTLAELHQAVTLAAPPPRSPALASRAPQRPEPMAQLLKPAARNSRRPRPAPSPRPARWPAVAATLLIASLLAVWVALERSGPKAPPRPAQAAQERQVPPLLAPAGASAQGESPRLDPPASTSRDQPAPGAADAPVDSTKETIVPANVIASTDPHPSAELLPAAQPDQPGRPATEGPEPPPQVAPAAAGDPPRLPGSGEPAGGGGSAAASPVLIDRVAVSERHYQSCVRAGWCSASPERDLCMAGRRGGPGDVAVCVTWNEAATYCAGRRQRLPHQQDWIDAVRDMRISVATAREWVEEGSIDGLGGATAGSHTRRANDVGFRCAER